jgi:hypothetical protein
MNQSAFVVKERSTKSPFYIFSISYAVIFLIAFAIVPIVFAGNLFPEYVYLLANLTLISVVFYLIGLNVKLGNEINFPKLILNFDKTLILLFTLFLFVVFVILITAPRIPIIESFKGASADDLSQYREDFLKGRKGWDVSLGYVIGVINAYILPYFIAVTFLRNHKYKYLVSGIFMIYSISFLEKAYFLKLAIPLFFIYFYNSKNKFLFFIRGIAVIFVFFFFMFVLAGTTGSTVTRDESFFSILYTPTGTFETIIWRAAVVPIVSAIDGVRVFLTEFGGQLFYGKTSSFFALLTGSEQVNFERALYQDQFGGNDTGNANQFFVIEAFINFGYLGVMLFSFIVGRIVRFSITSKDIALQTIMPLILFNLFNAGLIGILLSNGLLLFMLLLRFTKFNYQSK